MLPSSEMDPGRPDLVTGEAPDDIQLFWELAQELFCVVDETGVFLRVNAAWTRVLGWSEQELLGRSAFEFVHADDLEATRHVSVRRGGDGQRMEEFQNRYRHRDGSVRWMSWTGYKRGDRWFGVGRDVTATRTSHEALQRSERRSRAVIAALREGLVVFGTDGRIVEINDRFAEMVGLPAREILAARAPFPWWAPEDRDRISELFADTIRGARRSLEVVFMHRDGRRFPVVIDEVDLPARDGRPAALSVIRDISELTTARDQLAEAHRVAGLTSWEIFPEDDLVIVYADPLRRGPQATWTTTIDESLEPLLEPSRSELRRLRRETWEGARDEFSVDVATVEGERARFVEVRGEPLRVGDRIVGLRGTAQDITARKEAELADGLQRDALDALDVAVFAHDREGRVVHVNDAATRMLGWSRDEFLGRHRDALVCADEAATAAMASAREAGGTWEGRVDLMRRDGACAPVHLRAATMRDAADRLGYTASIIVPAPR